MDIKEGKSMNIAYLDKNGNVRKPATWAEVHESICNNWDSCEPCSYASGYSRTHGGWECTHPLCPHDGNKKEVSE